MSYKVTRKNEAVTYQAGAHFDVRTTRLHNPADVTDGHITMGLSHFLPAGGADMKEANGEMIYFIKDGEMTVTVKEEDGTETPYRLLAGDSIHMSVGQWRSSLNTGMEVAQMLVVVVK
jgi:mannose-6-phosphate isomerase-like protein (cupin superfamily)